MLILEIVHARIGDSCSNSFTTKMFRLTECHSTPDLLLVAQRYLQLQSVPGISLTHGVTSRCKDKEGRMTPEQILSLGAQLADFLDEFADCFSRSEPRGHLAS